MLPISYSINGAISLFDNADFFGVLVNVLIYHRDNDYGNDKAVQRLIRWKVAVGSAFAEISLAKELLRTDIARCKVSTKGEIRRTRVNTYFHKKFAG